MAQAAEVRLLIAKYLISTTFTFTGLALITTASADEWWKTTRSGKYGDWLDTCVSNGALNTPDNTVEFLRSKGDTNVRIEEHDLRAVVPSTGRQARVSLVVFTRGSGNYVIEFYRTAEECQLGLDLEREAEQAARQTEETARKQREADQAEQEAARQAEEIARKQREADQQAAQEAARKRREAEEQEKAKNAAEAAEKYRGILQGRPGVRFAPPQ